MINDDLEQKNQDAIYGKSLLEIKVSHPWLGKHFITLFSPFALSVTSMKLCFVAYTLALPVSQSHFLEQLKYIPLRGKTTIHLYPPGDKSHRILLIFNSLLRNRFRPSGQTFFLPEGLSRNTQRLCSKKKSARSIDRYAGKCYLCNRCLRQLFCVPFV